MSINTGILPSKVIQLSTVVLGDTKFGQHIIMTVLCENGEIYSGSVDKFEGFSLELKIEVEK